MVKKITYVQVPVEIFFNPDMTQLEKQLWWVIVGLDNEFGCTASNRYMGICLGVNHKTISRSITKLNVLGCIDILNSGENKALKRVIRIKPEYISNYKSGPEDFNNRRALAIKEAEALKIKLAGSSPKKTLKTTKTTKTPKKTLKTTKTPKLSVKIKTLKIPKKTPKTPKVREIVVKEIFTFWNSLGVPFTKHKTAGKNAALCYQAISETLMEHDKNDIMQSMKTFHELLDSKNTNVYPIKGLLGFLKPQTMGKWSRWPEWKKKYPNVKSLLVECLPGKNPKIKFQKVSPVEDKHPKITHKIMETYTKRVLRTRGVDYTTKEISNFRKCSNNFVAMFERNKYKKLSAARAFHMVDHLFNAIEKLKGGLDYTKCGVWLLGLDTFFQRDIELYFKEKSLINSLRAAPQMSSKNSEYRKRKKESNVTF